MNDANPEISTDEIGPLRVTGLSSGGEGVARMPDGRVVFIDGGVPGDLIEIADLTSRKRMARASIGRIVERSPDRGEPRCSHFGHCGGCRWQHIQYAAQLDAKRTLVRDALERIGGFKIVDEIDVIGSPDPYSYRARARLVESRGRLGYRMRGSHDLQGIVECPILVPPAQDALAELLESVKEDPSASHDGESRPNARRRQPISEWVISAGSQGPAIHRKIEKMRPRKNGGNRATQPGSGSVMLEVLGERIRASDTSFIQGNALLWDALAGEVCAQVMLPTRAAGGEAGPRNFVELYAGIGFLTLPLARRGLSGVAIESEPSAVSDLIENLSVAGFAKQVEVIEGRVESRRDLAKRIAHGDLLLLDPPRIGLAANLRDAIATAGPPRLVYVSCDPATLARDLRVFGNAGYELGSVRVLDMFPQTPHVEVVARLERIRR